MNLTEIDGKLSTLSQQLTILQSYLSLKFGLEFQDFYDRSLCRIVLSGVNLPPARTTTTGNEKPSTSNSHSSNNLCSDVSSKRMDPTVVSSSSTCSGILRTDTHEPNTEYSNNNEPHLVIDEYSPQQQEDTIPEYFAVKTEIDLEDMEADDDAESDVSVTDAGGLTVDKIADTIANEDECITGDFDDTAEFKPILTPTVTMTVEGEEQASGTVDPLGHLQNAKKDDDEDWTPELVDLSKTRRKDVSSGNFWVMTGKGPQRAPKVMRKRGRKRVVSAEVIVSSKSSTSSSVSSSDECTPPTRHTKATRKKKPSKPTGRFIDCVYCKKSVDTESLENRQSTNYKGTKDMETRYSCVGCRNEYNSTTEKIKNLWSRLLKDDTKPNS